MSHSPNLCPAVHVDSPRGQAVPLPEVHHVITVCLELLLEVRWEVGAFINHHTALSSREKESSSDHSWRMDQYASTGQCTSSHRISRLRRSERLSDSTTQLDAKQCPSGTTYRRCIECDGFTALVTNFELVDNEHPFHLVSSSPILFPRLAPTQSRDPPSSWKHRGFGRHHLSRACCTIW